MSEVTIEDKYEDSTSEELMQAIAECDDKKDKVKLIAMMRTAMRREETQLREQIKQEAEDSKEEKKLLKKTQVDLFEKRTEYLKAYRDMNAIMTGKSMLKNLDKLKDTISEFKDKSVEFMIAIENHLDNLHKIKNG